jgi:hypothetical protein
VPENIFQSPEKLEVRPAPGFLESSDLEDQKDLEYLKEQDDFPNVQMSFDMVKLDLQTMPRKLIFGKRNKNITERFVSFARLELNFDLIPCLGCL